jgi:NAD-dependent SIR2 family protein deacetylase
MNTWSPTAECPEVEALFISAGADLGDLTGVPAVGATDVLWQAYPGLKQAGFNWCQIASPSAFHLEPELAWGFYGHRMQLYRQATPNASVTHLLKWAETRANGWAVFTDHVGGMFQMAGFSRRPIVECQGSLHVLQCLTPCSDALWSADEFEPVVDLQSSRLISPLPRCPHCGELARPNVLMFNDIGWVAKRTRQQQKALKLWKETAGIGQVLELDAAAASSTVRAHTDSLKKMGWKVIRGDAGSHDMAAQQGHKQPCEGLSFA